MTKIEYAKECTLRNVGKVLIPDNETSDMWDSWELDVTAIISKLLSKDTIFLDIGANFGYYSLLVASKAKKVFSIEPNPLVYSMLYENSLHFSNIKTYNIGLADKVSKMKFYYRPGVWETGMLFPPLPNDNNFFFTPEILIETLSSFQTKYDGSCEHINLLKIDCEGSEYEILRDLEFFKKNNDCVVVLELHRSMIEDRRKLDYEEFIRFLEKNFSLYDFNWNKYDPYKVLDRGFLLLKYIRQV